MTREPRQSLTVLVDISDPTSCATALSQTRRTLEAAFALLPGLHTACVALLLPLPGASESALLFECSFDGPLLSLSEALLGSAGPELRQLFAHCADFPEPASARAWCEFLSARACRATACADADSPRAELNLWERVRIVVAAGRYWPTAVSKVAVDTAELERRRGAVGMQDWQPGVPLLHVARLPDDTHTRVRVRRALRALELEKAPLGHAARFMIHGQRLLFLAYPAQNAQLWTEQVCLRAFASLTRIWASVPDLLSRPWLRRKRRVRQLQRFLLDGRTPVAVWFNADARSSAV